MSDHTETARKKAAPHLAAIPCCPSLTPLDVCDKLDFFYRLTHNVAIAVRASLPLLSKAGLRQSVNDFCSEGKSKVST